MHGNSNIVLLNLKQKTKYIMCLALLSFTMGLFGGFFGTLFSKSIAFVTTVRVNNGWLIYLLPLGGIVTVALTKLLKLEGVGTNQVFKSCVSDNRISFLLAPLIFVCSVLTHFFGGSAGREGAALQLGGGTADLFCRIFKLSENVKRILIRCGMAAFFSAIFGTPIAASVFVLEVITVGKIFLPAVVPVFVSGITAHITSGLLGAETEHFSVSGIPGISAESVLLVFAVSALAAGVGCIFCHLLHITEKLFKKYLKNPFVIALIGGAAVVLLTLIVGSRDYNGGGIDVITRIFEENEVRYEAFILKIIFTVLTVAAGFKGGEIIPTLFIGAAFGGTFGAVFGMNPGFFAAVGMSAMFCSVTNSPLATVFLAVEMFGSDGIVYYATAVITAFAVSGKCSLYSAQEYSLKTE